MQLKLSAVMSCFCFVYVSLTSTFHFCSFLFFSFLVLILPSCSRLLISSLLHHRRFSHSPFLGSLSLLSAQSSHFLSSPINTLTLIFFLIPFSSCFPHSCPLLSPQKLQFTLPESLSPPPLLSKSPLSPEELSRHLERLLLEDMASDEQIFDWVEV